MTGYMERFTERSQQVMQYAQATALKYHHAEVDMGHFLVGMVGAKEGVAARILLIFNMDPLRAGALCAAIQREAVALDEKPERVTLSASVQKVIRMAIKKGEELGHPYIGTEHLLWAWLNAKDERTEAVMAVQGFPIEMMNEQIARAFTQKVFTPGVTTIRGADIQDVLSGRKPDVVIEGDDSRRLHLRVLNKVTDTMEVSFFLELSELAVILRAANAENYTDTSYLLEVTGGLVLEVKVYPQ